MESTLNFDNWMNKKSARPYKGETGRGDNDQENGILEKERASILHYSSAWIRYSSPTQ